jgi:uncharacterized tellurite resistance protein B-like protein
LTDESLNTEKGTDMITEDGKVEFTEAEQAEVNRIVGERLSRTGVHDMKEIVETLKEFGYNTEDLAGTKAEIKAQAAEFKRLQQEAIEQDRLESLKEQAKEEGTTPQLLAKIEKLEAKLLDIDGEREAKKQAAEQKRKEQERYVAEVGEFQEKFADVDVDKLLKNEDFAEFYEAANPKLTFSQVYEKFNKYATEAQKKAIAKIQANVDRSTSSGKGKGDPTGGTFGLTLNQQQLADDNGMTYKEYADSLKHVKK